MDVAAKLGITARAIADNTSVPIYQAVNIEHWLNNRLEPVKALVEGVANRANNFHDEYHAPRISGPFYGCQYKVCKEVRNDLAPFVEGE